MYLKPILTLCLIFLYSCGTNESTPDSRLSSTFDEVSRNQIQHIYVKKQGNNEYCIFPIDQNGKTLSLSRKSVTEAQIRKNFIENGLDIPLVGPLLIATTIPILSSINTNFHPKIKTLLIFGTATYLTLIPAKLFVERIKHGLLFEAAPNTTYIKHNNSDGIITHFSPKVNEVLIGIFLNIEGKGSLVCDSAFSLESLNI